VGLMEDIGPGPVALDTAIFIYFIEEHPQFLPLVDPLFAAVDAGSLEGATSSLTLLETLVVPYRTGNSALAERYEALLTQSRGIRLIDLDRFCLRTAAQLRASLRVATPDALQLAAALIWADGVRGRPFVVTDGRLRAAAAASGFDVRP